MAVLPILVVQFFLTNWKGMETILSGRKRRNRRFSFRFAGKQPVLYENSTRFVIRGSGLRNKNLFSRNKKTFSENKKTGFGGVSKLSHPFCLKKAPTFSSQGFVMS